MPGAGDAGDEAELAGAPQRVVERLHRRVDRPATRTVERDQPVVARDQVRRAPRAGSSARGRTSSGRGCAARPRHRAGRPRRACSRSCPAWCAKAARVVTSWLASAAAPTMPAPPMNRRRVQPDRPHASSWRAQVGADRRAARASRGRASAQRMVWSVQDDARRGGSRASCSRESPIGVSAGSPRNFCSAALSALANVMPVSRVVSSVDRVAAGRRLAGRRSCRCAGAFSPSHQPPAKPRCRSHDGEQVAGRAPRRGDVGIAVRRRPVERHVAHRRRDPVQRLQDAWPSRSPSGSSVRIVATTFSAGRRTFAPRLSQNSVERRIVVHHRQDRGVVLQVAVGDRVDELGRTGCRRRTARTASGPGCSPCTGAGRGSAATRRRPPRRRPRSCSGG